MINPLCHHIDKAKSLEQMYPIVDSAVDTAESAWMAYAEGANLAYAHAYMTVKGVLANVHSAEVARFEQEKELLVFCLDILTLGVTSEAVKTLLINPVANAVIQKMTPPSGDSAVPVGLGPAEYGARVRLSIHREIRKVQQEKKNFANLILTGAASDLEGGKKICRSILNNVMIINQPPDIDYSTILKGPARIALWCDWAARQDYGYWKGLETQRRDTSNYKTFMDRQTYGPVARDLQHLGVARSDCMATMEMYTTLRDETVYVGRAIAFSMIKLKRWVYSDDAFRKIFDRLPKSKDYWEAQRRFNLRRDKLKKIESWYA